MDSRYPTYYLNDRRLLRISPSAHRQYVMATAWCVSNYTDGAIHRDDLPLVPLATEEHAVELVGAGLWAETTDGWQVQDFHKTQTSAAQMEHSLHQRLENDRERQRRKREKDRQKGDDPDPDPSDGATRDVSRDDHVSSERQRQGKEEAEAEASSPEPEQVDFSTGEVYESSSSASTPDSSDSTAAAGRMPSVSEAPEHRPADPFGPTSSSSAADGPASVDFHEFAQQFGRGA